MLAKVFIATTPEPLKMSDTGADILYRLDENRLTDLPLVDGGNLVGSVREEDVYAMNDPDLPIEKQNPALTRDFVFENQHIFDVVKSMVVSRLNVLPVVNEKEQYAGCITPGRILPFLADMLSVTNPGAIIVLELNQNDYVLSEIAGILESQDIKILNLFVKSIHDSTKIEVIIKVNTLEVKGLLHTFNRYNYIVKATYTEDEKMYDDLRDRYDSLMKYLSI